MIMWPLPQLFQMTPALTWENTVPCNVRWDTRGMILAVRCASAAYPCPNADLWPALRLAPMDMCKYTHWTCGFLVATNPPTLIVFHVLKTTLAVSGITCRSMRILYTLFLHAHTQNSVMSVNCHFFPTTPKFYYWEKSCVLISVYYSCFPSNPSCIEIGYDLIKSSILVFSSDAQKPMSV